MCCKSTALLWCYWLVGGKAPGSSGLEWIVLQRPCEGHISITWPDLE